MSKNVLLTTPILFELSSRAFLVRAEPPKVLEKRVSIVNSQFGQREYVCIGNSVCVTYKILFKSRAILVPETQCVCPFSCMKIT